MVVCNLALGCKPGCRHTVLKEVSSIEVWHTGMDVAHEYMIDIQLGWIDRYHFSYIFGVRPIRQCAHT